MSNYRGVITGFILFWFLISLACASSNPVPEEVLNPGPEKRTKFGFFPTPPEPTEKSIISNLQSMSQYADVLLFQDSVPWHEFAEGIDVDSDKITEMTNIMAFINVIGLEPIFIVDPLNGLDRREFMDIPQEWNDINFGNEQVRSAYQNFALRLAKDFQPEYLGLASEINTYMDTYPEDVINFLSLYNETYEEIKSISPNTKVFVTFQWDDLNRLDGDGSPYNTKWDQIEMFEPNLDIWAISTYPYFFFDRATDIPETYYSTLKSRTDKPLAIAESGWSSKPVGIWHGSAEDQ